MKKKRFETFEELIKDRYGSPLRPSPRNVSSTAELFASYYGKPLRHHHGHHHGAHCHRDAQPSVRADDGEMLAQARGSGEYLVGGARSGSDGQEYVVASPGVTAALAIPGRGRALSVPDVRPAEEYRLDVRAPLRDVPQTAAAPTPAATRSRPAIPAQPPSGSPGAEPHSEVSEDDFIRDMRAILNGETAYDPATKKAVPRDQVRGADLGAARGSAAEPNGQAIFDRIAQSMQQVNAYDLGSVDLQNRFTDFDRIADLQQKAHAEKKRAAARGGAASYDVDSSAFLEDLEALHGKRRAPVDLATAASADKWERIASEVFGCAGYDDYLKTLKTCAFLGQTVANVQDEVTQKLSVVEQDLLASQGAGYTAPPVSSTLRKKAGMHGWGMAIDFDVLRNPYVLNESGERELDKEMIVAYDHIADFMLGKAQSDLGKLRGGRAAFGGGSIAEVYDALKAESDAMTRYFGLRGDDAALTAFVAQEWPAKHAGPAPSLADLKAQMTEDYEVLGGATAQGTKRPTGGKGDRPFAPTSGRGAGDPATGFLNLPRELVIAMTDAGFAWGAVDIAGEPGDIQHFDLRLQGNGKKAYDRLLAYG